jgi:hypothetical protein
MSIYYKKEENNALKVGWTFWKFLFLYLIIVDPFRSSLPRKPQEKEKIRRQSPENSQLKKTASKLASWMKNKILCIP